MFKVSGTFLLLAWLVVAPCWAVRALADSAGHSRTKSSLVKVEPTSPLAMARVRGSAERLNQSLRNARSPWHIAPTVATVSLFDKMQHASPIARAIQFDAQHLVGCGLKLQV